MTEARFSSMWTESSTRSSVDNYEAECGKQRKLVRAGGPCTQHPAHAHIVHSHSAGDSRAALQRFLLRSERSRLSLSISAMALAAGRFVVAGRSSALMGSDRQGTVSSPGTQCVSVSGSRSAAALQRSFSGVVAPVARRQLQAIATNSRVLELEEKSGALEFGEESEALEFEKEEESGPAGPSAFEIHNLLMQVCDETSNIAEVELKVGTFSMRVRREIGKAAPAPKPVSPGPPVLGQAMVEYKSADVPPSAPSKSTKLAKTAPSSAAVSKAAVDGGLLFVTSPKVGLFRQGRTVKGKSGPPLCIEGQVVKKGQVVCYLEQLGTQQPVEADIAGAVEEILCKDGEPVGYGDRLIAIRP